MLAKAARNKQSTEESKDNLLMFGRSYNLVGNSNSDFLIKTKGLVKIQWGAKFIDLIKDGKINVDASFISKARDVNSIGMKDGIYILDDDSVYIRVGGGEPINLIGEVGTTYVSFLEELKTTSELKYNALLNIGFIYKDLNSISEQSLKNGIIYVESDLKLYVVKDGLLSEFTISFPKSFTELFIIAKSNDAKGAIFIKGLGIANSLAFEKLFIYNEYGNSYVDSDGAIYFRVGSIDKFIIEKGNITFKDPVISSMFQSIGASEASGFRLYLRDGKSTLEIDNLIVRNSSGSVSSSQTVFPVQWYSKNNIIKGIEIISNSDNPREEEYQIELVFKNQYQVKDSLYSYATISNEGISLYVKIPCTVTSSNTESDNTLHVKIDQGIMDSPDIAEFSSVEIIESLKGLTIFLVGSEESPKTFLRKSEQGIDLITSSNFGDESNLSSILARVGNLSELGLKELDSETEVGVAGCGIYSKQIYFDKASYLNTYSLLEEDNSTKLASTEWVRRFFRNILPTGTIIAYHGNNIPTGWAICDGNNGTPNLIGKFIKADTSEGVGDEIEITPLDTLTGVNPLKVKISPTYYSLIFIMKIG